MKALVLAGPNLRKRISKSNTAKKSEFFNRLSLVHESKTLTPRSVVSHTR